MAQKAQGTQLYAIDPADESVITVGCVLSIDGIDTSIDQIETTCLEDTAKSFEAGLATPGTATFGIQTDPSDATHIRLLQLKNAGTTMDWTIGWSDGTVAPTVDTAGNWELGTARSWLSFEGYMNSFPFSFAQNSMVTSNVGIQVSGEPALVAKV